MNIVYASTDHTLSRLLLLQFHAKSAIVRLTDKAELEGYTNRVGLENVLWKAPFGFKHYFFDDRYETDSSCFTHGDLTLALTRCSCSALREVAVFVRECGKCKPLYASVIERCVTLPVGPRSVARKQSFRFVGGHVHNVTTLHFERKETKFVSNKTAIYRRTRSSVCLLFVKLALLCVFSSFI